MKTKISGPPETGRGCLQGQYPEGFFFLPGDTRPDLQCGPADDILISALDNHVFQTRKGRTLHAFGRTGKRPGRQVKKCTAP